MTFRSTPAAWRRPTGTTLPARFYQTVVGILRLTGFYYLRNERYAEIVSQLIGPSVAEGQLVVDLGCGPGGITSKLSGPYSILGLDRDRYLLRNFLDQRIPRIEGRGECLPFKNGSIDVVVAISLVEHMPDQAGFLREVARVLKRGGRAILQIPELRYPIEPHTKWPFLYLWSSAFQSKVLAATGYDDLDLSTSAARVIQLGSESGLQVEQTIPIWHFRLAKLIRRPMGFFIALKKPVDRRSPDYGASP